MKLRGYQASQAPLASQAGGFSLLEMVFVLGMVAILTTWITVSVTTVEAEQQLRKASGKIVSTATRARNVAVRQQRPYQVTIMKDKVSLAPMYPSSEGRNDRNDDNEGAQSKVIAHKDVIDTRANDAAVTFEIQRWASDEWILLEKDKQVTFSIDPSGLVEPIGIRCSIGDSWLIQRLHPLTASVRDEEMTIVKD